MVNPTIRDFSDYQNVAKIKTFNKYGIDTEQFAKDLYMTKDFSSGDLDQVFLAKVLQTYWYYDDYFKALYFENTEKHYIRYTDENGFYYLSNESDESSKVEIEVYTPDNSTYYINDENGVQLSEENRYICNFDGGYMYLYDSIRDFDGDIEKYYRIYPVTSETLAEAPDEATEEFLLHYQPRFYYDKKGIRYYLLPKFEPNVQYDSHITFFIESGEMKTETLIATQIVLLNNYFVDYNGTYYEIDYATYYDNAGDEFINPIVDMKTNTVTLTTASGDLDCYFDYNTKSLYDATIDKKVSFTHYIYCPINQNYQAISSQEGDKWISKAITIKSLPSPNIDFWYNGDNFGFVGYILVTNQIIEAMKVVPTVTESNKGEILLAFERYMNVVYSSQNFTKDKFADYDAGTDTSALYDEFVIAYGGVEAEAYNVFYRTLYENILGCISAYSREDLLKVLLLAERYEYNNGMIDGVYVNIPISFKDIMIDPRTGEQISMTVSVDTHRFAMISANTSIEDSVYAIPIYSPYILNFNQLAVNKSGSSIVVDTSKMDAWHFELSSDSSYCYNKANGDYLNFIALSYNQYEELIKNQYNISEYLSGMIKGLEGDRGKYIFTESNVDNIVTMDLSNDADYPSGNYVILAYYNKSGITNESEKYVVRVSDNVINVIKASDGSISYNISLLGDMLD